MSVKGQVSAFSGASFAARMGASSAARRRAGAATGIAAGIGVVLRGSALCAMVALSACAGGPSLEVGSLGPAAARPNVATISVAPQTPAPLSPAAGVLPQPSHLATRGEAAVPAGSVASTPPEPAEVNDPLELGNRAVFDTNQSLNHTFVYPVAKAYRNAVPEPVRDRIDAFTTNLSEPMIFANDVVQLRPGAALTTLGRFITNSTVGLGGLFDVAATVGQKHQSGDFGQTLYVWGVRDSPYLMLPVLGPTNVRDALGSGVEFLVPSAGLKVLPTKLASFASSYNTVDSFGRPVAGLGKVEMLEELEATSLDFYAMLRSLAEQKRQAELREALATSLLTAPTLEATGLLPSPAATVPRAASTTATAPTTVVIGIPREAR